MKNRKLLLIVSLALAMMMSLGGTLAYLTDTDGDVNVMTVGNVKIAQHEYERKSEVTTDDYGNTVVKKTNELQEFTQGQQIVPAVYGVKDNDQQKVELTVGDYTIGIRNFPNYVDKLVTAENIGNSPAFVRTLIATPIVKNEDIADDNVSKNWLHWNAISDEDTNPNNGWYFGKDMTDDYPALADQWIIPGVMINGQEYEVAVVTNVDVLTAGEETGPCMAGFYLDKALDYDEGGYYAYNSTTNEKEYVWEDSEMKIYVLTQAVQSSGFSTAFEAFANAFPIPTDTTAAKTELAKWFEKVLEENENGGDEGDEEPKLPTTSWLTEGNYDIEWYNDSDSEFTLNSADQLAGLSKLVADGKSFAGKTVKLGENINLGAHLWTPIGQKSTEKYFQGTFDGDNKTISNMYVNELRTDEEWGAGLFGSIAQLKAKIQNVTIDGAIVNGHHWTAVVVGYMTGVVDNCHVTNATVTCTHANDDACGDKAGIIVGYVNDNENKITNNSATNCTVTAGRDAGQIIGSVYPNMNNTSGNTASNVVVNATGDCPKEDNIRNEIIGRPLYQ